MKHQVAIDVLETMTPVQDPVDPWYILQPGHDQLEYLMEISKESNYAVIMIDQVYFYLLFPCLQLAWIDIDCLEMRKQEFARG